ncbi:hypothetical protein B0H17DRAFT_1188081 [Mycena rosella]|uniref:Uncharacterized protein n=1 Tax=Mycena rosella TaxID=1033263 RepID=A0AAD7BMI1_MYCRO|nr:hypothetical protein B0H17DRAFT_1188081 [Mycena rosella]
MAIGHHRFLRLAYRIRGCAKSPITVPIASVRDRANQSRWRASFPRLSFASSFRNHHHPPRPHTTHPAPTAATMNSTTNSSSYSLPLPSPVSPSSLSMETPSLGSSELLPRPKRGAPPVAPHSSKKADAPTDKNGKKDEKPAVLDPALCEGW